MDYYSFESRFDDYTRILRGAARDSANAWRDIVFEYFTDLSIRYVCCVVREFPATRTYTDHTLRPPQHAVDLLHRRLTVVQSRDADDVIAEICPAAKSIWRAMRKKVPPVHCANSKCVNAILVGLSGFYEGLIHEITSDIHQDIAPIQLPAEVEDALVVVFSIRVALDQDALACGRITFALDTSGENERGGGADTSPAVSIMHISNKRRDDIDGLREYVESHYTAVVRENIARLNAHMMEIVDANTVDLEEPDLIDAMDVAAEVTRKYTAYIPLAPAVWRQE